MFIKTSFISFFLSGLYYLWIYFFDSGVGATINAPQNIKPGETVSIEVIIKKGNIGGFAKLQIETSPEQNCTIEEQDSKAASFSSNTNSAKWIWTALPMQQEFKVIFKLKVPASASGNITLSGKFSYIENNTKQIAEIPPVTILLGDKKEPLAQQNPTPTKDTTKLSITTTNTTAPTNTLSNEPSANTNSTIPNTNTIPENTTTPTAENINLSRTIQNISPDTWLVKINIQKNNLKGFARYTDVLPKGLTAKAEDKDGSSFFIDHDNIKFVWSSLPDKSTLNISYKLTGNITNPVTLNGDFSYTENNQVLNKTLSPETIQPPTSLTSKENKNNTSNPVSTPALSPTNNTIAETSVQAKQTGVFFSVQLGAYQKSNITTSYFSKKYNIIQVKEETQETYKKFYTGDFNEYKQARDKREQIKSKGITDAFVIAHKDNVRITVQEALMITNQKWYP